MPHLILDKEYQQYKIFSFAERINIGRGAENNIVLDATKKATISREHAFIRKEKDRFVLHDTSKNGTLVQNRKITSLPLNDGTRFEIDDYGFTFVADPEPLTRTSQEDLHSDETCFIPTSNKDIQRNKSLKAKLKDLGIVVHTESMLALYRDVEEVAQVNVPVLILGEPGTGKEKIAQAIHSFSGLQGAFVPLNCSSIPEGIFESEIFGSVKGAFHNATDKPGKLEMANNGTVFFDEVGDMALVLQPKLLRFLEDKMVTRLGDTRSKRVNVRFVAATNQNLDKMIQEGRFRDDLFQRLACITLTIPPLRKRKDDILPLAEHFLTKFSSEHSLPEQIITDDGKQALLSYSWPGNVRELGNILLNCAVRNRNGRITSAALELGHPDSPPAEESAGEGFPSLEEMEKKHIQQALQQAAGNKLKTAKMLGISRDTLYNKIRKFKIDTP